MTSRQPPRSPWPIAVVLLAALAAPATAAPPKISVQSDRKDAQIGQPVRVTVRVRGATTTPTVKPPTIAGAQFAQVGEPTSVPTLVADMEGSGVFHPGGSQHAANILRALGQMPNPAALDPDVAKMIQGQQQALQGIAGLNTNDYLFTYQVTPERTGLLVVPAFTVTTDGQATLTAPLSVNVTEAKPQPWVQMRLSLSDPTPSVGEEVQLYVDLLIQRGQVNYGGKTYAYLPVSKMALTLPPLDGARQIEPARPLDQLVQENAIEPGKHGFRVNNFPIEVKLEHEPDDGQGAGLDPARYRRRLSIPVRVREGGQVTLAAAHAAGEVFVPTAGNKGQWEPFVVTSEPISFAILDLRRRADRPPDFSGAVGEVRVSAEASQTQMPAGTPFTLSVRLQGNGSVASIGAPDLAGRPEFSDGFRVRLEESRTLPGNVREFNYALRPLSEIVKEVPPVSVSYFDPKSNKFGSAHSEPIPLRVTAAANATPDAPPAAPEPPAPVRDEEPAPGFRLDSLLPWAEGAMAVAALACVVAWGVRRLRGPRPAVAPVEPSRPAPPVALPQPIARPATPAPRHQPVPPPTFAEVRQALQDFLRRHFRLPPGEVTSRDAGESLRRGGAPEGLARSFAALLDTCETAEFAPGVVNTSPSDLSAYARRLMDQVVASIPEVVA
jgi:BatD DUF11 like domain